MSPRYHPPTCRCCCHAPRRTDPEVRFWRQVDKSAGPDGCWLWTGKSLVRGYGHFLADYKPNRKRTLSHRYSWMLANGAPPAGALVCHRCDVPLCVNPAHLFLGTHADNTRDMVQKGRGVNPVADANRRKTHCPYGHEYPASKPGKVRECRTCRNARRRVGSTVLEYLKKKEAA